MIVFALIMFQPANGDIINALAMFIANSWSTSTELHRNMNTYAPAMTIIMILFVVFCFKLASKKQIEI